MAIVFQIVTKKFLCMTKVCKSKKWFLKLHKHKHKQKFSEDINNIGTSLNLNMRTDMLMSSLEIYTA